VGALKRKKKKRRERESKHHNLDAAAAATTTTSSSFYMAAPEDVIVNTYGGMDNLQKYLRLSAVNGHIIWCANPPFAQHSTQPHYMMTVVFNKVPRSFIPNFQQERAELSSYDRLDLMCRRVIMGESPGVLSTCNSAMMDRAPLWYGPLGHRGMLSSKLYKWLEVPDELLSADYDDTDDAELVGIRTRGQVGSCIRDHMLSTPGLSMLSHHFNLISLHEIAYHRLFLHAYDFNASHEHCEHWRRAFRAREANHVELVHHVRNVLGAVLRDVFDKLKIRSNMIPQVMDYLVYEPPTWNPSHACA
jgi:hypothetical protein